MTILFPLVYSSVCFRLDVTLKDGETIGFSEDQKIKITESKAVYLEAYLKLDV